MKNNLTVVGTDRFEEGLMVTFSDDSVAIFTAGELLSLAPRRYTCEELEALLQSNEED